MRVLGPVFLLLLAGCSVGPGPGQGGYRVTYTVESPSPHFLGTLSVQYTEGRDTVRLETPRPIKTWSVDVWVSELLPAYLTAELPDGVAEKVQEITNFQSFGYPVRCRIAVNGVEVRNQETDNRCLTQFDLSDYEGAMSERAPATTHPPQLWPETTAEPTPAPPTSTAPAEPRPDACRYATDDEITDIVSRSGAGALLFAGVTTTYPFSCLYRFAPLPTGGPPVATSPFTGVTVIRYPARFGAGDLRGDPVPGAPGAKRTSDREISTNLRDGALTVQADLGSAFADSHAVEEVFELVRSRA
jgi:hypothetical protein